MTLATVLILVCGIVAIIFGVINKEIKASTFWFLLSFWLALWLPGVVTTVIR